MGIISVIISAVVGIGVAVLVAYVSVLIDVKEHYKMVAERYEELYYAAMMEKEPESYLKK